MFTKQNIAANQKVTVDDYNAFGDHPRAAIDALVKDFGGFPGLRYVGLVTEQTGAATIRVSGGRLYAPDGAGYLFDSETGQTIDFLELLPATTKMIATIVAWGVAGDTALEPRTFLIDPVARTTEGRETATEHRRYVNIGFELGLENPTPLPPTIASNMVAIAHVILTPAGVESVTQVTANRVISNSRLANDVSAINARMTAFGSQMDTLRTDVSGLAGRARQLASLSSVQALYREIARLKDKARLPDDYVAYGADLYETELESDTESAGYAARIDGGLRFPAGGLVRAPIGLANPVDPAVKIDGNMALPVHSAQVRLSVVGADTEYPLTNTTSTTQTARLVTEARNVQVFAGTEEVMRSTTAGGVQTEWQGGKQKVLRHNEPVPSSYKEKASGSIVQGDSWTVYEVAKYATQTVYSQRTEYVTQTVDISGSMMAQTYLNSQEGYLVGLDLYFTKKASSGDVRVLLVDVGLDGKPMLDRVHEQAVIPHAAIKIFPAATSVDIKPMHQRKGSRYAIVLVSSAPHFIAQLTGNKLAEGSQFYWIDDKPVQASSGVDMAMQLKFASFSATRITLGLNPLELAGGIDSIKINADVALPEGTDIVYEIMVAGVWRPLFEGADGINLLSGAPTVVQFRAVLLGTTDVMPALGIGAARSEVTLVRPATALNHLSKPRLLAAPTNQIVVEVRLENWDGANGHSHSCSLLCGAAYALTETADATVTEVSMDGQATIKRYTFNVTSVSQFKIRQQGAKGGSNKTFHVSERLDYEH